MQRKQRECLIRSKRRAFEAILILMLLLAGMTWMKFAELEALLGDADRARAIYELAIAQPALDMPEVLWKSYIDFEIEQEEYENARNLYRRLLQRTRHVKVSAVLLR